MGTGAGTGFNGCSDFVACADLTERCAKRLRNQSVKRVQIPGPEEEEGVEVENRMSFFGADCATFSVPRGM